VLLDFAGAVAQLYAFDAYGNAIGFNPAEALTEFLYSGEQFDSKIGQQYLRARYYDPTTGRFNRLDPFFGSLSDPQSLHKYLYAHGNPINGIDPSGSMTVGVACAISLGTFVAIGAVSAVGTSFFYGSHYDGTYWGATKVQTGAISAGVLQGWLNCINAVQDFGIGIYDLFAFLVNLRTFNVTVGQTPIYLPYFSSPDWSRNLVTHEYGDELERWEKWFFDTHDWSKFTGGSGLVTLVTFGANSFISAFSKTAGKGVPESANYVQKTFRQTFSPQGRFSGKTIDDVATELRLGKLNPKDVPIEIFVTESGNTLILNTRSAHALTRAGIPRSQWHAIVINEDTEALKRLSGQLTRNKLSLDGIENPTPR
jgi:RHS repeat-associated protein